MAASLVAYPMACIDLKCFSFVDSLPRKVQIRTPKVAVRRRLPIDRSTELHILDNSSWSQVEVSGDEILNDLMFHLACLERFYTD